MEKNINSNVLNYNNELLNFLDTKSYKSLNTHNKDSNKAVFQVNNSKNESTITSDNKTKDIIKNIPLDEVNIIKNYIPKNKESNLEEPQHDNIINSKNEEFIYKVLSFLLNLCKTINLKDEDISKIFNNVRIFLIQNLQQHEEEELESKKLIYLSLKRLLGDDFKNKVLLIKRASTWLGLNKLNNNEEYLSFLTKLSELGDMLSEDQGIKNEQHSFILTKEEAKKQRNSLISDDNFKVALTNKMHPSHKDALNKLRSLNKIIIS